MAKTIGLVIHQCGTLEFCVNNTIRHFGKDKILVNEVLKYRFLQRIDLLRKLLLDRAAINQNDVNSLCECLKKIAEDRNRIAHNPIASLDPNLNEPFVLLLRNAPTQTQHMSIDDVKKIGERASEAIAQFCKLIPQCVKCDTQ